MRANKNNIIPALSKSNTSFDISPRTEQKAKKIIAKIMKFILPMFALIAASFLFTPYLPISPYLSSAVVVITTTFLIIRNIKKDLKKNGRPVRFIDQKTPKKLSFRNQERPGAISASPNIPSKPQPNIKKI
jgi:hypothetical protein